jgi:hypothetical protein
VGISWVNGGAILYTCDLGNVSESTSATLCSYVLVFTNSHVRLVEVNIARCDAVSLVYELDCDLMFMLN